MSVELVAIDRGAGADGDPTPVAEEPTERAAPADVLSDTAPAPEPRIDYARVAEVAIAAIEQGRSTATAVAEVFGCSVPAARQWMMRARRRGHEISMGKPGRKRGYRPVVTDRRVTVVLVCDDCGAEFATDRYLALRDHVTMEHNRKVRDGERTPRPREATA